MLGQGPYNKIIQSIIIYNQVTQAYFEIYLVGQGVNGKGYNSKLAMVKMCSTLPLLNKYALSKKFEVILQTPPVPQTPIWPVGKSKFGNLNFVFAMVKMYSQ